MRNTYEIQNYLKCFEYEVSIFDLVLFVLFYMLSKEILVLCES